MALFVILAGLLLILGGGISLLAGFDIVMTERGSAMTIGGVVALSGGTITLAVGFALLRLSQILRVLQTVDADEKAQETEQETESASLPASIETIEPKVITSEPLVQTPITTVADATKIEADTILRSPLKPREIEVAPKKPGFFRSRAKLAGLGAAGAAGAAILASTAAQAHPEKEKQEKDGHESEDMLVPPPSEMADSDSSMPKIPEDVSLNLEAELSRALAEDTILNDTLPPFVKADQSSSTDQETSADIESLTTEATEATEARSFNFNEGLAQVLSKPKKRGKRATPADGPLSSEPIDQEVSNDDDAPVAALGGDEGSLLHQETAEELIPEPEEKIAEVTKPEVHSVKEVDLEMTATGLQTESRPAILGTYNAGDGTYVMYADGTVEAINEQGVKRFKSMEELRAHLAKT